jgi:hypothetical protein
MAWLTLPLPLWVRFRAAPSRRETINGLNRPEDHDTRLSYHGNRWFEPRTARWLTAGPLLMQPDPEMLASARDLSLTAAKEFLCGGGAAEALRAFLVRTAGRLGAAGNESVVAGLQAQATSLGRVLHVGDARIAYAMH